ncbi:hypothetical protein H696_03636 [Fonticula alba]|uniref:Uncharacterized protein n=1 Tax=Fonticula alba TaxID=691883 RepID=A0A058Z9H9_FONAL|nr:hypothetical protein H696_03636 [Fonticula alba]KCV70177.1 hypothetical protein H696_03636 [Fonticula alba]|eukprot:XP_009495783.1 hypothetical protein H696_03636 [Fonticula alba]
MTGQGASGPTPPSPSVTVDPISANANRRERELERAWINSARVNFPPPTAASAPPSREPSIRSGGQSTGPSSPSAPGALANGQEAETAPLKSGDGSAPGRVVSSPGATFDTARHLWFHFDPRTSNLRIHVFTMTNVEHIMDFGALADQRDLSAAEVCARISELEKLACPGHAPGFGPSKVEPNLLDVFSLWIVSDELELQYRPDDSVVDLLDRLPRLLEKYTHRPVTGDLVDPGTGGYLTPDAGGVGTLSGGADEHANSPGTGGSIMGSASAALTAFTQTLRRAGREGPGDLADQPAHLPADQQLHLLSPGSHRLLSPLLTGKQSRSATEGGPGGSDPSDRPAPLIRPRWRFVFRRRSLLSPELEAAAFQTHLAWARLLFAEARVSFLSGRLGMGADLASAGGRPGTGAAGALAMRAVDMLALRAAAVLWRLDVVEGAAAPESLDPGPGGAPAPDDPHPWQRWLPAPMWHRALERWADGRPAVDLERSPSSARLSSFGIGRGAGSQATLSPDPADSSDPAGAAAQAGNNRLGRRRSTMVRRSGAGIGPGAHGACWRDQLRQHARVALDLILDPYVLWRLFLRLARLSPLYGTTAFPACRDSPPHGHFEKRTEHLALCVGPYGASVLDQATSRLLATFPYGELHWSYQSNFVQFDRFTDSVSRMESRRSEERMGACGYFSSFAYCDPPNPSDPADPAFMGYQLPGSRDSSLSALASPASDVSAPTPLLGSGGGGGGSPSNMGSSMPEEDPLSFHIFDQLFGGSGATTPAALSPELPQQQPRRPSAGTRSKLGPGHGEAHEMTTLGSGGGGSSPGPGLPPPVSSAPRERQSSLSRLVGGGNGGAPAVDAPRRGSFLEQSLSSLSSALRPGGSTTSEEAALAMCPFRRIACEEVGTCAASVAMEGWVEALHCRALEHCFPIGPDSMAVITPQSRVAARLISYAIGRLNHIDRKAARNKTGAM